MKPKTKMETRRRCQAQATTRVYLISPRLTNRFEFVSADVHLDSLSRFRKEWLRIEFWGAMFDYGMNLFMIVTVFGVSSMFIVFVCTRLVCARRATLRREQRQDSLTDVELRQRRQTVHGLDEIVIANFPTTKFNTEDFSSEEDAQCSICLGEYQEGDILRIMPKCGHAFHVTCIDTWLLKHSTCPFCRLSLKDASHVHQSISPTFGMTTETESSDTTSTTTSMVPDA